MRVFDAIIAIIVAAAVLNVGLSAAHFVYQLVGDLFQARGASEALDERETGGRS